MKELNPHKCATNDCKNRAIGLPTLFFSEKNTNDQLETILLVPLCESCMLKTHIESLLGRERFDMIIEAYASKGFEIDTSKTTCGFSLEASPVYQSALLAYLDKAEPHGNA